MVADLELERDDVGYPDMVRQVLQDSIVAQNSTLVHVVRMVFRRMSDGVGHSGFQLMGLGALGHIGSTGLDQPSRLTSARDFVREILDDARLGIHLVACALLGERFDATQDILLGRSA